MTRKPPVALALALVVSACTRPDPGNVRLVPGTLALVVAGETKTILRGDGGPVELAPGVMVRVGDDPGEYRETQAQFESIRQVAPGEMTEAERKGGPRVFPEGHDKARFRSVQVVVESGEHKGLAGKVGRLHLIPAP